MKHLLRLMGKSTDAIEKGSNACSGWLIICLLLIVTADVSYRFVFNKTIAGAYSLSELIMVGICFLSMSYTQKEKGHVAVDFFILKLEGRTLHFVEITSSLMSIIISFLLFYRSAVEARIAVKIDLVTSGIVNWPAWPLKIIVAFGFLMLTIRIAIQIKQQIYLIRMGD
ncbi:TRAP transporter small permease [Desulfobacula sp.]|uniref:TRAP transporter small permease n=1 Tax=Desulfobacula sp. TaxID=2593537 RepID=UPI002610E066|nr:TRAP transporter small permease [Desulfobacula sp.]